MGDRGNHRHLLAGKVKLQLRHSAFGSQLINDLGFANEAKRQRKQWLIEQRILTTRYRLIGFIHFNSYLFGMSLN